MGVSVNGGFLKLPDGAMIGLDTIKAVIPGGEDGEGWRLVIRYRVSGDFMAESHAHIARFPGRDHRDEARDALERVMRGDGSAMWLELLSGVE